MPRGHLDALADAGLCGLAGPVEYGGCAAPTSVTRPAYEALAGACGVTFFVWVQHHAPVRLLARSDNDGLRDRWLPGLCQGSVLGGVAFAYLRRPGPPAVVARAVPGGWRVRGEAPWVTSWGLARLFAVAAAIEADDGDGDGDTSAAPGGRGPGQALFFLLDAETAGPSVRPTPPLAMSAMAASATVRLAFDDLFVPADQVVATIDIGAWRGRDRAATSQPHPAPFGLATTATRLLGERAAVGPGGGQPAVDRASRSLAAELDQCRDRSYALSDSERTDDAHLNAMVEARALSLDLAMRSAQALVAATGGRAMGLDHPAQRLVREAAFWSIQAQSSPLREATLGIVSAPRRPRAG